MQWVITLDKDQGMVTLKGNVVTAIRVKSDYWLNMTLTRYSCDLSAHGVVIIL